MSETEISLAVDEIVGEFAWLIDQYEVFMDNCIRQTGDQNADFVSAYTVWFCRGNQHEQLRPQDVAIANELGWISRQLTVDSAHAWFTVEACSVSTVNYEGCAEVNNEDYDRFWRSQGSAHMPAEPVPDHLIDADWRIGHE